MGQAIVIPLQTPKRYFRMDDDWETVEQAAQAADVTVWEWMREGLPRAA